ILKEIFRHLSPGDLERCRDVNTIWRSIADPMFVDYQIIWISARTMSVKIRMGYGDQQIEERSSTIEAEMEYLKNMKPPIFIDLTLDFSEQLQFSHSEKRICREFVTRFGPMVYKLTHKQVGINHVASFFLCGYSQDDGTGSDFGIYCRDFPNAEELRLSCGFWAQFVCRHDNFWVNLNVQKFYFEPFNTKFENFTATRLLEVVPNVREIYCLPLTMVEELRQMKKLHLLRSVEYYEHYFRDSVTRGMDPLVEVKLKIASMLIGTPHLQSNREIIFVNQNKQNFKKLLELGKNTMEHLIVRPLKTEDLISFPKEMPGVKKITLWSRVNRGYLYFRKGEDLDKLFPNLNTISFKDFSVHTWAEFEGSWLPGGIFYSEKLRQKIKYLKYAVESSNPQTCPQNLLDKFTAVERLDIEKEDFTSGILFRP
ncbi:unnamed protein product, partial [Allacma fusca]